MRPLTFEKLGLLRRMENSLVREGQSVCVKLTSRLKMN